MRKLRAFLRRDRLIATSYRTAFAVQVLSTVLWVPVCYFVGAGLSAGGGSYAGDPFAFLLIGVGLLGYMAISLRTFHRNVRDSQLMGTLEIVLLSPTSIAELLFYSSAWVYLLTTARFLLFLAVGTAFGLQLGSANPLTAAAVLLLAIPAFASFGIASAALVLVIKRGESINLILSTGSLLFGGVLYPVDALPAWLRPVSHALPITHALEAMRAALLQGASPALVGPQLAALAAFGAAGIPVSLALFRAAVRRTKATGTLAHY